MSYEKNFTKSKKKIFIFMIYREIEQLNLVAQLRFLKEICTVRNYILPIFYMYNNRIYFLSKIIIKFKYSLTCVKLVDIFLIHSVISKKKEKKNLITSLLEKYVRYYFGIECIRFRIINL
jgi:hypothetical protein